jgi:RimJ/RimL family protein N-acetyltransferase
VTKRTKSSRRWLDEHESDVYVKRARESGFRSRAVFIPDALLPSLCDCRNRLGVDAPTGDLFFELERMTPEIVRHREETARKQRRTLLTTLAITGDGQVVAYNDLVVLAPPNPNVSQWGTLVLPEHRGHRLGMAVKARGLKELQRRIGPHVRRVSTSNAETNAYMVAINERLGFRPVEVTPGFLYRTTDHEAPAALTEPDRVPATLS